MEKQKYREIINVYFVNDGVKAFEDFDRYEINATIGFLILTYGKAEVFINMGNLLYFELLYAICTV